MSSVKGAASYACEEFPGAVLTYDQSGKVVDANPAACRLLGTSLQELLGSAAAQAGWRTADESVVSGLEGAHPALAALKTRLPVRGALVQASRGDGKTIWIQADANVVQSALADRPRVVVSLTDVSRFVLHRDRQLQGAREAELVAEVIAQLADANMAPQAILSALTRTLSERRRGTWVAALLNKNPTTARVAAANRSDPEVARYIENMHTSGAAAATSISTRVIETGEAFFMPATRYDEFTSLLTTEVRDFMSRNRPPTVRPTSEIVTLVVPMRARHATMGTLGLFHDGDGEAVTKDDIEWVQRIADHAGLAIDNAQLYVDAVSRLNRLESLRSVGLAVSSSQDLRLTLNVILDQVTEQLEIDAADVLLLDETDGMLVLADSKGFRATTANYRLPVDDSLPGSAINAGRIETAANLNAFSQLRRRSLFAREGFHAYWAVPLFARGKLVGALEIFHRSPINPDPEWVAFLDALASEAAIAIDNAAMFGRLKEVRPDAQVRSSGPALDLNQSERHILGLLVEGKTNREIAAQVHLSQNTVKFHVRHLLEKTGTANRTELARRATQERWL